MDISNKYWWEGTTRIKVYFLGHQKETINLIVYILILFGFGHTSCVFISHLIELWINMMSSPERWKVETSQPNIRPGNLRSPLPTSRWMSMSEGSNSFKFLTSKAGKKGFPINYSFCFLAAPPSRHHYRWSSATSTTITAILFLSPPFNISVTFSPPPHVIQII